MSVSDALGPQTGPCHPVVYHQTGASILKDEDVLLVEFQRPWPGCSSSMEVVTPTPGGDCGDGCSSGGGSARCSGCGACTDEYSLFAVFDGHNGVAAARLVADNLVCMLEDKLPPGPPPPTTSPTFVPWREDIQLALVETLAELNKMFAQKGILAGCTATMVLQIGWLLTCANLGDSRAILDTGLESIMMTVDHRVATHKGERRRVEAMGNTIAPIDFSGSGPATRVDNGVGPLRIWPGGLCLSRAIGDFDVGESVIPFPHIRQVMVPPTGARLLVASDGVWDAYEKMNRITAMMRQWGIETAPARVIQSIVRAYGGLRDDTSLIIVDILPPGKTFPEAAQGVAARSKASGGGSSGGHAGFGSSSVGGGSDGGSICGCFGSAPAALLSPLAAAAAEQAETVVPRPQSPLAAAAARVEVTMLADVDVAAVMGMMPEAPAAMPGWYDEYVGEQLFGLAADAMESWQDASEKRTGRRAPMHQQESSVRAARAAKAALERGEGEPLVDEEGAAWAPAQLDGGMRRAASMFFQGATADDQQSYAEMFGHYKGHKPQPVGSDSPGSSMHSGTQAGAAAGGGGDGGDPSGSGHSGSGRSGGYRYVDASVRAGNRFFLDASVRAGSRYAGDSSVRAGSRYAGDFSVRAGGAYFVDGGSGAGGGGTRQGSGQPGFRPDPSIRSGKAALRMMTSDSANSREASLLAKAAGAEEAPSGSRDSSAGSIGRSDSPALTSGGGGIGGIGGGSGSAPITVPRISGGKGVSFGDVQVMGAGASPNDSPTDHTQVLAASGGSGHGGSAHMTTILEA